MNITRILQALSNLMELQNNTDYYL